VEQSGPSWSKFSLMGEWHEKSLGEFVSLQRGHDLPEGLRKPGRIPILGSFGVTGMHSTPKVKGPGVTVGRSGASIGVVAYIDRDYWPLNTCLYVTDFHGNNPRYVYYLLKTLNLASFNSGSAQPSLNRNFIQPVRIVVPERTEQDRIVGLLGALDDKIELNRQSNETLESMARAIFKDWFVDFGPTRANKESRRPYLAPDTWALFPNTLDEDNKPAGWTRATVSDIALQPKSSITPSDFPDELFDHYSIPAYDAGQMPVADLGSAVARLFFRILPSSPAQPAQVRSHGKGGCGAIEKLLLAVTP
jgi:type I restriction enzyme, S subunit